MTLRARPRTRGSATPLILILIATATPCLGQTTIDEDNACRNCISLDTVLRIGSVDGPTALPGAPTAMVVDSQRRYWFLLGYRGPPLIVESDGSSVNQVGRSGDGPGEFRDSRSAVAIGDSIAVYDARLQRMTVLDSDLSLVRTVRFFAPSPHDLVPIQWPHTVLAAGVGRGSDLVGWPLHIVDVSGSDAAVVRSMGEGDGNFRPGMSERGLLRTVARGSGSSFWSARIHGAYELSRWSREGRLLEGFIRSPEWFRPGTDSLSGSRDTPPKASVVGVYQRGDGWLMTVLMVPRPDWREAWADKPKPPPGDGPRPLPGRFFPRTVELYEALFEVIDIESNRVVARTTLSGLPIDVLSDGTVAIYTESEAGIPYVTIVEVAVAAR